MYIEIVTEDKTRNIVNREVEFLKWINSQSKIEIRVWLDGNFNLVGPHTSMTSLIDLR